MSKSLVELLLEQQREQQNMLVALAEQQREELVQHRREVAEFKAQQGALEDV